MHIQKVIEQLGYRPNEVRVYLATLSLGECTVSEIAAKIKLPRTSIQAIIDTLHQHGLVNFYIKKRFRYWTASSPERLLITLHEREAALRFVLPALNAMLQTSDGRPTVKVFNGPEEIKLIMEDMLATQQHISAIMSGDNWTKLFGDE